MELHIRNSFFRDWDNISSRLLNKEIGNITDKVKYANSVSDVHRMKKLVGSVNKYKIELRHSNKNLLDLMPKVWASNRLLQDKI